MKLEQFKAQHFKEYRVGIVVDDFTGPTNYQTCSDLDFYDKAEELGYVFTLNGFEKYIYSGEFKALQDNVEHPQYLIVRHMPVYETQDGILLDDIGRTEL